MGIKETNKKTFIVISALRNKNKYEALISVARQHHPWASSLHHLL